MKVGTVVADTDGPMNEVNKKAVNMTEMNILIFFIFTTQMFRKIKSHLITITLEKVKKFPADQIKLLSSHFDMTIF